MYLDTNTPIKPTTISNNIPICNKDNFKFAIAIIVGLGCLAMLGCGVAGHFGVLSSLNRIGCYSLIATGSAGLLVMIIGSIISLKNQQGLVSTWKKHGIVVDEIPMPEEIKQTLSDSTNLIPVLIPPNLTIEILKQVISEQGLEMEISLPDDAYGAKSHALLTNKEPYWVVWKTEMAFDFLNYNPLNKLPEGLQDDLHYEIPTAIEAAICLLAEFMKTGQLRTCTIACQELPHLSLYDTMNFLSVEARNQRISFKIFNARIQKAEAYNEQRLIKRFKEQC